MYASVALYVIYRIPQFVIALNYDTIKGLLFRKRTFFLTVPLFAGFYCRMARSYWIDWFDCDRIGCKYFTNDCMEWPIHIAIHSLSTKKVCSTCHFIGSSREDMESHSVLEHTDGKLCPKCFFTTTNLTKMQRHMRKHNYPFICDVCNERIENKNDLDAHKKEHEDEERDLCNEQECKFYNKDVIRVKRHKYIRHKEAPFCDVCFADFPTMCKFMHHFYSGECLNGNFCL